MSTNEPFWSRFLSIGVKPEMSFDLRRRLHVFNGAALATVLSTGIFLTLNFFARRYDLAASNACAFALGVSTLILLHRGWRRTGMVLFLIGTSVAFTAASLSFRNGVDFYLLIVVSAPLLILDSKFWRRFTAILGGSAFVAIQAFHFAHPETPKVPLHRFLANVAVFVISLYWYNAIFRSIHDHTLNVIVEKNRELEGNRLLLEAEHAKLLDRTAQLDEANAAKEKLFSVIGHDLRGPVGNVKQSLALLEDGTLSAEEFQDLQRDLSRGVDHVHASLENLMEWAAAQMGSLQPRFEPIPVREAAGTALNLLSALAEEKGITLHDDLPAGSAVRADAHQLEAVLRNLLSNAIKFTPVGGRVSLTARDEGSLWRITVRDTGVGMEPDRAASLFLARSDYRSTPGTRNEKGLGLGLQICRDFVRAHGGTISAESEPGRGSAFHVSLPRA